MIRIITPSQEIQNTQQVVEVFQKNLPDLIFEAAKDVADIIQDRVEGQGLATNGSPLVTPSNNPIGRYGQRHGQARQARGLNTGKVDLRFTGQMWDSWGETQDGLQTEVGFDNQEAANKMMMNEYLYGVDIRLPNEAELNEVDRRMDLMINNLLENL